MFCATKKTVVFDADGVVLDYISGFFRYCLSAGYEPACTPSEVTKYDMTDVFPGLDSEKVVELFKAFSYSDQFASIPFFDGALDVIRYAQHELRLNVVCVTSAGDDPSVVAKRNANLETCGFNHIEVLPFRGSKRSIFRKLPLGTPVYDDLYDHVFEANNCGLNGVLMLRPYNINIEYDQSACTWASVKLQLSKYAD